MTDDNLTVLHSVNRRHATKRITRNPKTGEIKNRSYDREHHFRVEIVPVGNFAGLCAALTRFTEQPFAFVIRGEPAPGINPNYTRRLLHPDRKSGDPATFTAAPRHWFAVDMDHIAAPVTIDPVTDPDGAIDHLIGLLPPELADASCWWQWTSSQSLPGHEDTLSARLWYRSVEPLGDADLKRWAATANGSVKLIDIALYNPVQAHYIARPVFDGMTDPLPRRYGVHAGLEDEVSLILPPPDPKNPEVASGQGYAPGRGVQAYLAEIGGGRGFRVPIKSAVASYIAIQGSKADCEPLKVAIREAIDDADAGGRSTDDIDRYRSDEYLDDLIRWTRERHGDQPPKGFQPEPPPHLDDPLWPEPPPTPPAPRPTLRVVAGELPAVVDAAETILVDRDRDLYEFADQIVRPALAPIRIADNKQTIGLRLVPVRLHHMIERFTRIIDFQKYSRTRLQWEATDCPEAVAKAYLERVGVWRLPKLAMITCCPLLLSDGRILDRPGFDAASGILFDPQGVVFPPVPPHPTADQARQSLDLLKALFAEFPFVDAASRSVMWSALLSSVARPAFDFVPLHGFDAPVAGTGKSKLVDRCAVLVRGHECPVTSQGDDETEFEKRLGAELLEGSRLISVDNCERPLGGALLCQTATQHFLKVRVLGFSKTVIVTNGTLMFATGNNLQLYGDMLRRGVIGRLDAGVERPELRTFTREDPVHTLKRERGRYVSAALTVLHAFNVAGRPVTRQPLGGFEGWSRLVRDTLIWLGEVDPVETIEGARSGDPERQKLEAVIAQWRQVLDNRSVTTRAVIEEACWFDLTPTPSNPNHITYRHPEFRNALLDVANERGRVSVGRLGKWIGANQHKVIGKDRLAADTPAAGNARWRLERRQTDGTWR